MFGFIKPVNKKKPVVVKPVKEYGTVNIPAFENELDEVINKTVDSIGDSTTVSFIDDKFDHINPIKKSVLVTKTDNDSFASLCLEPNMDHLKDISVYDKNMNLIATGDEIGMIGVTVENENIPALIYGTAQIFAELQYNYDRMYNNSKDLTTGYWIGNKL